MRLLVIALLLAGCDYHSGRNPNTVLGTDITRATEICARYGGIGAILYDENPDSWDGLVVCDGGHEERLWDELPMTEEALLDWPHNAIRSRCVRLSGDSSREREHYRCGEIGVWINESFPPCPEGFTCVGGGSAAFRR